MSKRSRNRQISSREMPVGGRHTESYFEWTYEGRLKGSYLCLVGETEEMLRYRVTHMIVCNEWT